MKQPKNRTIRKAIVSKDPMEPKKEPTTISPNSGQLVEPKKYSDADQTRINALIKKLEGPRAPSFKLKEDETIEPNGDEVLHHVGIFETFASNSSSFTNSLTNQLYNAAPGDSSSKLMYLNAALQLIYGMKPKDELEGVLATQMAGVHNLAMEFMRRAMHPGQSPEGVSTNTERTVKMLRLFTSQVETLNRYRGKGQQKVTVEHVTVNSGGQAIVGQVNSPSSKGGGGSE